MIIGLGSDLCNIERIQASLDRFGTRFETRVFTAAEQAKAARRPMTKAGTLAKRFAAKEALIKALGDSTGVSWHDMRVVNNELGNPSFELHHSTHAIAHARGITAIHLSMSHDAGIAIAYVVAES